MLYEVITAVLILQLLNETLLPFLAYRLSMIHGPLLTSVLLFLVPALLLGTLSPYAIKLVITSYSIHYTKLYDSFQGEIIGRKNTSSYFIHLLI